MSKNKNKFGLTNTMNIDEYKETISNLLEHKCNVDKNILNELSDNIYVLDYYQDKIKKSSKNINKLQKKYIKCEKKYRRFIVDLILNLLGLGFVYLSIASVFAITGIESIVLFLLLSAAMLFVSKDKIINMAKKIILVKKHINKRKQEFMDKSNDLELLIRNKEHTLYQINILFDKIDKNVIVYNDNVNYSNKFCYNKENNCNINKLESDIYFEEENVLNNSNNNVKRRVRKNNENGRN